MFRGYSGRARLIGAVIAVVGTVMLSSSLVPRTPWAHTIGWGLIALLAAGVNYFALAWWYAKQPEDSRGLTSIRPVFDSLPALVCGALLTFVFIRGGLYDLLFGMWMLLFGVMHTSSRHSLPPRIWWLGWFYIAAGLWYYFIIDTQDFLNPWPMGCVFMVGEIAGGIILRSHRLTAESQIEE